MNKVILMGRLTKAPEIKYLQDDNKTAMARYTLAVDRRYGKDREKGRRFYFLRDIRKECRVCRTLFEKKEPRSSSADEPHRKLYGQRKE